MRTGVTDKPAPGRPMLWGVAATLAGLVLIGCGSVKQPGDAPSRPVPGRPVPTSALHNLRVIAERAARVNGDRAPAWVTVVVTTHEKALTSATPGDTEPFGQNTIVYLVTMKGHFVARDASTPPGAHAPAGTYLSMVINARTFKSLDFGVSGKPPPVAPGSLGPVTYLKAVA